MTVKDKKKVNKVMDTKKTKDLKQVKDHYLDYPYPHRNPEDDKTKLMSIVGDYLGEINHYLYKGKQDFKKGFRVLVAGGGTGDSTVFLSEQLDGVKGAEVVYLDFSKNSMKVAQERVKNRGRNNVTWINESLLDLPKLKLGKFDYIQCSGVLHHLESPDTGLKLLSDSLNKGGGLGIMVYAQYGRTGVYQIQEAMRMINKGITSRQEEVKNAWEIINNLPATNWYSRGKDLLADHVLFGDAGMYDMFLHKQDRAYTIPELYQFLKRADLNLVEFTEAYNKLMLDINNYIKDQQILERVKKLDKVTQQAICEVLCGSIIKHTFYASKETDTIADFKDLNNVPYFYTMTHIPKQAAEYLDKNNLVGGNMDFSWQSNTLEEVKLNIPVSEYTKYLFKAMDGGTKSFKQIFAEIEKGVGKKVPLNELQREVERTLTAINKVGILLLRNKNTHFPDIVETINK
ncbi:MAG: class I SAM-dependent methyltransferase [Rickettsiaceae bacterium]|nr:class I SAM-dependent methyltransferase [Rickettsiaceae bacterium]